MGISCTGKATAQLPFPPRGGGLPAQHKTLPDPASAPANSLHGSSARPTAGDLHSPSATQPCTVPLAWGAQMPPSHPPHLGFPRCSAWAALWWPAHGGNSGGRAQWSNVCRSDRFAIWAGADRWPLRRLAACCRSISGASWSEARRPAGAFTKASSVFVCLGHGRSRPVVRVTDHPALGRGLPSIRRTATVTSNTNACVLLSSDSLQQFFLQMVSPLFFVYSFQQNLCFLYSPFFAFFFFFCGLSWMYVC